MSFRVTPEFRSKLVALAEADIRSQAGVLEKLVSDEVERRGLTIRAARRS